MGKESWMNSEDSPSKTASKPSPWPPILVGIVVLSLVGVVLLTQNSIIGLFYTQEGNIVSFDIQDGWNISNGFIRISQNLTVIDVTNLTELIEQNHIVINLDDYSLETGFVYIDLILNETLVDSAYIFFTRNESQPALQTPEEAPVTEAPNSPATMTEEPPASIYSDGSLIEPSGKYQIDYVNIEPKTAYKNNTLTCVNGTLSRDVSRMYYLWYVNSTVIPYANSSTLAAGNFTTKDRLDCGILPQNGTNLVAYWSFDEGRGSVAYETVANISGVIANATWTDGRNFKALTFTDSTNNISIVNPTGLNVSANFTYEMWIYQTSASPTTQAIYTLDTFEIKARTGKITVAFVLPGGSPPPVERINSTTQIPLNTWTHVAITYNNTLLTLYINGTLDNSTRIEGPVEAAGNITIAAHPISAGFRGRIDEIVIYNETLDAATIADHHERGTVRLSKNQRVEFDTSQADFGNGTCSNTNCTIKPGNVTLVNISTSAYALRGNLTSRIFDIPDHDGAAQLFWNNHTTPGQNLTLQVRTGDISYNRSKLFGQFSGPDPTHAEDSNIIIGLDFSEGYGNISTSVDGTQQAEMRNNDFTLEGKHGMAARLYGETEIPVDDFPALRLIGTNFTIELWIKPSSVSDVGILGKVTYRLYTNSSGNLIFNLSNGTDKTAVSTSPLTNDTWTHIIITKNRDNVTKLYINGTLEATASNGTVDSGTTSLTLGQVATFSRFVGTMDSVTFYSRTLTEQEIFDHAQDRFINGIAGDQIGHLHRFVQYRAYLDTPVSTRTPTLTDVTIRSSDYGTNINSLPPASISLQGPDNNTLFTTGSVLFNWTNSSDLEGDLIFYEFILANQSNFSSVHVAQLAINNYSEVDYTDDNHTVMVEHFESKYLMQVQGWGGNFSQSRDEGRFGNGFAIESSPTFLTNGNGLIDDEATTIEFWVKPNWNPNDDDGQANYFISQGTNGPHLNRTGTLLKFHLGGSIDPKTLTYNLTSWSANEWHHVAIAWQETRNMSLIIDGVVVNRTSAPSLPELTSDLFIGSSALSTRANATFDELRISNVARGGYTDFNMTNITVVASSLNDGTYYWRARAMTKFNKTLDSESLAAEWTDRQAIRVDTNYPILSQSPQPRATISDGNYTLNVTSDSDVTCQYGTSSGGFSTMETTGSTTHQQNVTLSQFGNFSYFVRCNDLGNHSANTTISFYVFNRSIGTVEENSTLFNFTANEALVYNFSTDIGVMGGFEITTNANVTGRVHLVRHLTVMPENDSASGLLDRSLFYHTYIIDEDVYNNITGNITFYLQYTQGGLVGNATTTAVAYYNLTSQQWSIISTETIPGQAGLYKFNTSYMGTYVITLDLPPLTRGRRAADAEAKPVLTEGEYFFEEIIKGEENSIEADDADGTGIMYLYFATDMDLSAVSIILSDGDVDEDDEYNAFEIRGIGIETDDLEYLVIGYAISKEWADANGTTFVLINETGNEYELVYSDEDDDYYYYEVQTDAFGLFTVTVPSEEEEEAVTEEGAEEEEEETEETSAAEAAEIIEGPIIGIFTYILIAGLGMFYLIQLGLAGIFTLQKKYKIREQELQLEFENWDLVKYYIYANQDKPKLDEELLQRGYDAETVMRLISNVKRLKRGELQKYIYTHLARGADETSLVQTLAKRGWSEKALKEEIRKFRES